jgi:tyrosinase
MPLRKNFVFLTSAERTRLASALNAVNASGFLGTLASQHSANFNSGIHWGSAFLPWHRWFLRVLEQQMQVHEPGVMIPYWDWTRPDSRNIDVEPWKSFFGGRSNTGGRFDHWTYTRSSTDGGAHLPELLPGGMGSSMVNRLAATTFAGFRAIESSGGHGGGHNWVGGTMAGGDSPRDPLFWLHHGNIDRLWAIWQRNHAAATQYDLTPAPGNDSVPAAMVPLGSAMIGGATPASMLDHRTLGYTYDTDVRLEGAWESTGRPHLATSDATQVDLYIRDSSGDTGSTPTAAPHWESPDIWVRTSPPGPTENPDDGHQAPIVNQPNHVYVTVHNRGASTTSPVAVEAYHCTPGTGMLWPTHFQALGSLSVASVPAGGHAPSCGHRPSPGTSACWRSPAPRARTREPSRPLTAPRSRPAARRRWTTRCS